MLLFTQGRSTPLQLYMPLETFSLVTQTTPSTSGNALVRPNGLCTSWCMKMLPTLGLLPVNIYLLPLMFFILRVLLHVWTSEELPSTISHQGCYFLSLTGGNYKSFQPSYAKDGSWLLFIGKLVILCARTTWAILNYASIGKFRQCFFLAEYIQCLCSHCQVETYWHIFANCCQFGHVPMTDPLLLVKDFVKFLKEHSSTFIFVLQDCLPPEPPWVFLVFLFCFCR